MESKPVRPAQDSLAELAKRYDVKSRDHPAEIKARLRREEDEAAHQRKRDLIILYAVLIAVGIVSVICMIVIFVHGLGSDDEKWATTVLTMIVSAGLGYMTGRGSK